MKRPEFQTVAPRSSRRDPEAAVACMNNHLLLAQQDLVVSPAGTDG